jgi:hypothetical protein
MRRSTTSAATDHRAREERDRQRAHARNRTRLAALLITELLCAVLVLGRIQAPAGPTIATPASLTTPAATTTQTLSDGRTVHLAGLGGRASAMLLTRIAAEMDGAAGAVTAFWGTDWPRQINIVAAGSDEQFRILAGGAPDIAATATADRIMFAPGATAMTDQDLRTVVRHELFHYAARADTAADAPQWLTEGVADFVARPRAPRDASVQAVIPTDAELSAEGPARSAAYDRAWWFSRFVADTYGTTALRDLYIRACGHGHPDVATAVRQALGADLDAVTDRWRQWMRLA